MQLYSIPNFRNVSEYFSTIISYDTLQKLHIYIIIHHKKNCTLLNSDANDALENADLFKTTFNQNVHAF